MKRFLSAVFLCGLLLAAGFFFSSPSSEAQNNLVADLLKLPAPPPPNPLNKTISDGERDPGFYDKTKPPPDDAPIQDLLDYWTRQSESYQELRFNPKPSDETVRRLLNACDEDPKKCAGLLNVFPSDDRVADKMKALYDRALEDKAFGNAWSNKMRQWLTYNSKYFPEKLKSGAAAVRDQNEYVTNQEDLLALAKVDWSSAQPHVNRMMAGEGKVSRVLAQWAHYVNALKNNDVGDIERYRSELKAVVEDKNATPGMRDLALDALVKETDWDGRDDWYFSLLADETLSDLRVNGQSYTGLTTIILYSPPDKYIKKMVELLRTDNPVVRGNVVRNLTQVIQSGDPEVLKALLPWLHDAKWAKETNGERRRIVEALRHTEVPESVPGLITLLNEKAVVQRYVPNYNAANAAYNASNSAASAAHRAAEAANRAAEAANAAAEAVMVAVNSNSSTYRANSSNAANLAYGRMVSEEGYPLRDSAIYALGAQKDPRAVAALRSVLAKVDTYMRTQVVRAIYNSQGYSVNEQVSALEGMLRKLKEIEQAATKDARARGIDLANKSSEGAIAYAGNYISGLMGWSEQFDATTEPLLLANVLNGETEVSDRLVMAMINRIEVLQKSDPEIATALRLIMRQWRGPAINMMALRDLKRGTITTDLTIRLLAQRKELRQLMANEIYDAKSGVPFSRGVVACLVEDQSEYETILNGENEDVKIAMFGCARMIRAQLPLAKVAEYLKSPNKLLATAAARYLESEDSPEARQAVLAAFPDQMTVLGARAAFEVEDGGASYDHQDMRMLFDSIENSSGPVLLEMNYSTVINIEKRLKKELTESKELLGVYSYAGNFIRLYADRVVFSWEEDVSRYRERTLTKEEFDEFRNYIAGQNVDLSSPYLSSCETCTGSELLMLGRAGGRRVFFLSDEGSRSKLQQDLDAMFAALREKPAKLHYWLEKFVPGLEILYADDDLQAKTLWKNGPDLRLMIDNKARREKAIEEMEKAMYGDEEEYGDEGEVEYRAEDEEILPPVVVNSNANAVIGLRNHLGEGEGWDEKRERIIRENHAWYSFVDGKLTGITSQPPGVEFFPLKDSLPAQATPTQWKARAAGFEIRAGDEGLYKVAGGNATLIKEGSYTDPVVTANGRWVIATKTVEYRPELVRINLTNRQEFPIAIADTGYTREAVAFIAAHNKVLLFSGMYGYGHHDEEEAEYGEDGPPTVVNGKYYLLDADTGKFLEVPNEVRPLKQQTFRPLQPTGEPDTFWAAIPGGGKTQLGTYNTRTLTFKSLLTVPEIEFDSMGMWADITEGKVYFVYNGHLLRLPMPKTGAGQGQ